jgi:hypothetical protein
MGDRLFKTTLDAHVVAISAKSGAILWDAVMENFRNGYGGTPAPLAFRTRSSSAWQGQCGVRVRRCVRRSNGKAREVLYHRRPRGSGPQNVAGQDASLGARGGSTWTTGSQIRNRI